MNLRRRREPPPPARPPVREISPRELRLERALRLCRSMLVEQEKADHATIGMIDSALRADP